VNIGMRSIRNKLVITFVSLVIMIIGGSSWFLYYSTRRSLEDQLGEQLIAIARMAAAQIDGEIVINLMPGDEGSRTYANLIGKLKRIKEATGAKRLYVFDRHNRSLLDTDEDARIGREYVELRFRRSELEAVWDGRPSCSILFKGSDGAFYKTGFAPIEVGEEVVAAVGVDVSAAFVGTIERFGRNMVMFGFMAVLITVAAGFLLAKTITDPIGDLVHFAREIGRGNFEGKVAVKSKDELGYLADAMDRMRKDIVERDRQLKAMLAGIAHEIRNPLGGIEIFAGLAAEELGDDSEAKEHLRKIVKEARNLNMIVGEFLEFARPSEPKKRPVPLDALIDDVASLHDFHNRGIAFRKELPKDQIYLHVDPEQVERAFRNLFNNSIQAMEKGGELIVRGERDGNYVRVEVKDTGIGIPREDVERIFDPFFTTKSRGIGLGLSIVKKVVEENGGRISVESEPGKGTTFTIWLPSL